MKADGIMIGNYLNKNVKGNVYKIEVSHEDIYHIACGNSKHYSKIKITEDELLNIGFKVDDSGVYYSHLGFDIVKSHNDFEVYYNGSYLTIVDYVNELQNVIYSITFVNLHYKKINDKLKDNE